MPRLKAQGADAIVVLIHEGGKTSGHSDPDGCDALGGAIRGIVARLRPGVDLIVSGHTHWAYVCDYAAIDPAHPLLLTSAGLYGELVTDIALAIDPAAHKVVGRHAHNLIVQSAPYTSAHGAVANTDLYPRFAPRADVAAYVKRYVDASKVFAQRPIGKLSGPAAKGEGADSNIGATLGNLVADSQLAATRGAGAQIAFMNPFGIRAPLVPAADGTVTFGDLYQVQPFGNALVTESLTGAEIKAVLEQGFDTNGPEQVLAPSAGFAFRFDRSRTVGERVVEMTLDGKPIDPAARYRVTVNAFLALGGDAFTVFLNKPDAVTGPNDLDAFESWIKAVPVRSVPQDVRAAPVTP